VSSAFELVIEKGSMSSNVFEAVQASATAASLPAGWLSKRVRPPVKSSFRVR